MTADDERLRPGVAVTPLRNGLHLRGRRGSVTLEGSTALPGLWRLLEGPLRAGEAEALLRQAEPGTPVRAALDTVFAQLRAHDLLMPAAAADAPDWLAASAADPATTAAALAAVRAEVTSGARGGALAGAVIRALARSGVTCTHAPGEDGLPDEAVLVRAWGPGREHAVAAGTTDDSGYVTAPGTPAQAQADATALTARLRTTPSPAGGVDSGVRTAGRPLRDVPASFVSLLAGAGAQRLLCAAGGMPDPAEEGDDPRLPAGVPAVLVATVRPGRAEYRAWAGGARVELRPARTLDEALRRVAVLGDERVGVLAAPEPGALRQLPVPLAACEVPGGTLLAGAPRLDLARLDAFCRAAELRLGGAGCAVGADPGHAWGRALRRAVPAPGGVPLPAAAWSGHPQARHGWTTLTERLGVTASVEVFPVGADGEVYQAVVCGARAVEATPGDAAAFALLGAIAARSAAEQGVTHRYLSTGDGSVAPLAAAGVTLAAWEDTGWTAGWLAGVARREAALHTALHRLTRLRTGPAPAPAGLAAHLTALGFTVLHTEESSK
ncbi:hypothetical protein GCM10010218_40800 [Streptomyces mashuensis]|uniref:Uncharacterized protein n=1 Tax=Streptomyces mashuensis TaxID=33904 RepID=A0A919B4W1_9ACTN|nr:hypothetical protein [Streptomyces mashuensis]GHF55219.1 hypothetical protein GCM10010218_40800 [Streptomyces mashuensis]